MVGDPSAEIARQEQREEGEAEHLGTRSARKLDNKFDLVEAEQRVWFSDTVSRTATLPFSQRVSQRVSRFSSLELVVLPGAADLGGEALGQLLQAAGVLQLDLGLAPEELLQVLQQLDARLGLLLQALELLHQLVTDLCGRQKDAREL